MFLSGLADEASPVLRRQIEAHRALGWGHVEIRNIEGKNLTDLGDDAFDRAAAAIEESGLQVSCFSSQLANWSRRIDSDFERDIEEMRRAVPRMAGCDAVHPLHELPQRRPSLGGLPVADARPCGA